jgi:hypothetical protein
MKEKEGSFDRPEIGSICRVEEVPFTPSWCPAKSQKKDF